MSDTTRRRSDAAREARRLRALHGYRLLDTGRETGFDDLTQLAARACGTPVALVSLVDADRVWFKSAFGTTATELPREGFPCAHAIREEDVFVVPDITRDARFATFGRLAPDEPPVRFYAGVPLRTAQGHALGALAILDGRPRVLKEQGRESLLALGRQVLAQMEHRHALALLQCETRARERAESALCESEGRFHEFMNRGPANAYIKDTEGRFLYVNEPLAQIFQRPVDQWLGADGR